MKTTIRAICAPLLILLVAGCGDFLVGSRPGPEFQRRKLAENRALWEARGTSSYQYILTVECACIPPHLQEKVLVTVENGVDRYEYAEPDPENPLTPPAAFADYTTVQKLFTRIEEWIPQRKLIFQLWYDPQRGFPSMIHFVESADAHAITVRVTEFVPLSE